MCGSSSSAAARPASSWRRALQCRVRAAPLRARSVRRGAAAGDPDRSRSAASCRPCRRSSPRPRSGAGGARRPGADRHPGGRGDPGRHRHRVGRADRGRSQGVGGGRQGDGHPRRYRRARDDAATASSSCGRRCRRRATTGSSRSAIAAASCRRAASVRCRRAPRPPTRWRPPPSPTWSASWTGRPLRAFDYRDHGSLVSLSRFSTVGSLMGSLIGGRMAIEGRLARLRLHLALSACI